MFADKQIQGRYQMFITETYSIIFLDNLEINLKLNIKGFHLIIRGQYMITIKTSATVEDVRHLKLEKSIDSLTAGAKVDLIILFNSNDDKKNWRQVLKGIGTYDENDLAEFELVREELNKWQPREY